MGRLLCYAVIGIVFSFLLANLKILKSASPSSQIDYGRELLTNTAHYLGPQGKVGSFTKTRMSCQNCHLEGGTQLFAMPMTHTYNSYPQYRPREGKILSLEERINNCFERPMNGRSLPTAGKEMRALIAYIKSISNKQAPKARLISVTYLNRPASSEKGKIVFINNCVRCHGIDGQGKLNETHTSFEFPPLWGNESYNIGSSMHRITVIAAFIKANMPFGVTYLKPLLTDEEAYDVAAFINDDTIHSRPSLNISTDYPNIRDKPIDHPKGPYFDPFPESQHRLGPFKPIVDWLSVS